MIACTSMALVSCAPKIDSGDAINYCESQNKALKLTSQRYSYNRYTDIPCVTVYQYCSEVTRETFLDIVDTVSTTSNQQDTISKSMSEQIDKCLASVKK